MDNPPLLSVQQQQAEQMRVYWKVSLGRASLLGSNTDLNIFYT